MIIGIGLVQLHRRKFGIVLDAHALVAEYTAYLVYLLKASHNQALQVQFGLDTQVHVHIQGVVVGHKGPGRRADFQGMEHRRVHLQISPGIQELPDKGGDAAALDEGILDLRIDNQIQIPLTVPGIRIL